MNKEELWKAMKTPTIKGCFNCEHDDITSDPSICFSCHEHNEVLLADLVTDPNLWEDKWIWNRIR